MESFNHTPSSWSLYIAVCSSFVFVFSFFLWEAHFIIHYFSILNTSSSLFVHGCLPVLCCASQELFVELPLAHIPALFQRGSESRRVSILTLQCITEAKHRSLNLSTYEFVQFACKKWSNSYLMGLALYKMQEKRSEFVSLIPRLHPCPSINFF